MIVSDQQAAAIMHGTKFEAQFEPIDQGEGPRSIPPWAKAAHINWMEGYGNAPAVALLFAYDPIKDIEKTAVWYKRGSMYIGEIEGVASVHYHGGPVAWRDKKLFRLWTPSKGKGIRYRPDQRHEVTVKALQTTMQEGYGGRTFIVRMAPDSDFHPGCEIELRGPWHGGAPDGYVEVSGLVYDAEHRKRHLADLKWKRRLVHLGPDRFRWYRQTLCFGYYIREDIFLDVMAVLLPHIRWARVTTSYGTRVQPLMPDTGLPKGWN